MQKQLASRLDTLLQQERQEEITVPIGSDYTGLIQLDLAMVPYLAVAGNPDTGKTLFVQTLMAEMMLKYPPEKVQFMIYSSDNHAYAPFSDSPYVSRFLEPDVFGSGLQDFLMQIMKGGKTPKGDRSHTFLIVDRLQSLQLRQAFGLRSILVNGKKNNLHGIAVVDAAAGKEYFDLFANETCHISFCMDSKCGRDFMGESMTGALDTQNEILCKWASRYHKCKPMLLTPEEIGTAVKLTGRDT